jgi:hypothetical protein
VVGVETTGALSLVISVSVFFFFQNIMSLFLSHRAVKEKRYFYKFLLHYRSKTDRLSLFLWEVADRNHEKPLLT